MAKGANNRSSETSSSSSSVIEDVSGPYYLQSSDHPGLVLVTHLLDGTNYSSWSRAMTLALTAKNKVVFVDGSISRPPATDLLFPPWNRYNSMVISWLLNSVTKSIADSLVYFTNAFDIWADLCTRFQQANGPRIFQLKQEIASFHQGSLDVNSYYTKLKTLCDELQTYIPAPPCTCGGLRHLSVSQQQHDVLQFLMGLNDSFSSVRAQLLLLDPLPSLARVFSLVLQEERQRQISISMPPTIDTPLLNSVSSTTASTDSPPVVAATVAPRRSRPFCTYCHAQWHVKDKCFRLHGFPPGTNPSLPGPIPLAHQPIPLWPTLILYFHLTLIPNPQLIPRPQLHNLNMLTSSCSSTTVLLQLRSLPPPLPPSLIVHLQEQASVVRSPPLILIFAGY